MPRKSALLLSLLNLVLKPISELTSAPSNYSVALPQHPPVHDREAWRAYWKAQGQPWRTEPEIDEKRQAELDRRRAIVPDIDQGIYPFKETKLNRADVEWLLATHETGRGPIHWRDESQQERDGVDLRGADLRQVDLHQLPLSRIRGGLTRSEWYLLPQEHRKERKECRAQAAILLDGADLHEAHLEGAFLIGAQLKNTLLRSAHLEDADLSWSRLDGAILRGTHLEGAHLWATQVPGADLNGARLEKAQLSNIILANENHVGPQLADVHWDNANLAVVKWPQVIMLGDEHEAQQKKTHMGAVKERVTRLREYEAAVRANRQLGVVLQGQGLNEDAARFAYRAQVLQKRVFRFQMLQKGAKLRQRAQALGAWLFSWFLFLLAGYGHRLWRSFLAYTLVIIGFTTVYYLLGVSFKPPLSLVNALGLSMTSFHGRGFFPGVTQLNDSLTLLASVEAFVGLVLEATFIATLTQRFFGK